ncbi:MAG: asparagine synthase (glutamine-hydrolyzing) [Spirochaetia bacterium]|nr:asparagine synthase (glutamine-hydrolyzing) [Spirochaetia bacterium]
MCGIAGAFDLRGSRTFPGDLLARMSAVLSRRGPDADGFISEPGYAATVRRLILRDAAGGKQPMRDNRGSICLNGELFSFARDRTRLEQMGVVFETRSDTEVFLKGLHHEGLSFLSNADGQFSFAYRDAHHLLLARDTSGITPLFFAEVEGWLLFASEVKGILASGMIRSALNNLAVDRILTLLASAPGESCFVGIHSLRPGQLLRTQGRTWTLSAFSDVRPESEEVISIREPGQIDRLEGLLLDSVARRLEADVPVGLYLSGGVDSSLIAAMASRLSPQKLTTYSIRLNNDSSKTDESDFAAMTAASHGLRHLVLTVTPGDLMNNFPNAVLAAEMPILDHANICLLMLAQLAREDGSRAVLSGEGADEAFAGYPWHAWSNPALRIPLEWMAHNVSSQLTRQTVQPFWGLNQYLLFSALASLRSHFYSKQFLEEVMENAPSNPWKSFTPSMQGSGSRLQKSLDFDREWLLAGHLLADKGDRVSMFSSVEARYPFLDPSIKRMSSRLADSWKMRDYSNKWILRKVAERYLSRETAWRKKHLFRTEPVIHGPGRPRWVDQLLSPESISHTGLFDPRLVQKHLAARQQPHFWPRNPFLEVGLSGVVSTQLLHHLFCGGGLCDLPTSGAPVKTNSIKHPELSI